MRVITTLFVTIVLALSVNAALIKRTDDPQFQLCMNDLVLASNQLAMVKADVDSFTSSKGYAGALAIHDKEQTLESRLTTAGTTCCAVSDVVTNVDTDAFLGVVQNMVSLIQGALGSIVTKMPQFDAILLATTIIKTDVKNLNFKANSLFDTCLFRATPESYVLIANEYVGNI